MKLSLLNENGRPVIWLTGLPGAGKTTIAKTLEVELRNRGYKVEVLDGDEVRMGLSPELGFSKRDRELHAKRVAYISKLLSKNGVFTIVALISPFRSIRQDAREAIGKDFVEVWIKTPLEVCRRRDPKGMYKKAEEGKLSNLTGIQDPYEPPLNVELELDTQNEKPEASTQKLIDLLEKMGHFV